MVIYQKCGNTYEKSWMEKQQKNFNLEAVSNDSFMVRHNK